MNIAWKELFVILIAVQSWGIHWTKQNIIFHCNNQAVVDIWEKGASHDDNIMALVYQLYFGVAQYNINVCVIHIPGAVVLTLMHCLILRWQSYTSSPHRQSKLQVTFPLGLPSHSSTPPAMPSSWSCHLNLMLILFRHIPLPTLLHSVWLFTTLSIIPNSTVLLC